eukprot:6202696-Pleurochrysis_carterae.AAC.1
MSSNCHRNHCLNTPFVQQNFASGALKRRVSARATRSFCSKCACTGAARGGEQACADQRALECSTGLHAWKAVHSNVACMRLCARTYRVKQVGAQWLSMRSKRLKAASIGPTRED